MFAKPLVTALAIAIATPTFADTMLERTLGVPPGLYSIAQLAELEAARSDDDRKRVDYILSHPAGALATRARTSLAVQTTPAERQIISSALEENDFHRARFVADGGLRQSSDTAPAYRVRLAADLGEDPSLTLSRLIKLQDEREN